MGLTGMKSHSARHAALAKPTAQSKAAAAHHSVLHIRVLRTARQAGQQNEHRRILRQLLRRGQVLCVERHAAAIGPARTRKSSRSTVGWCPGHMRCKPTSYLDKTETAWTRSPKRQELPAHVQQLSVLRARAACGALQAASCFKKPNQASQTIKLTCAAALGRTARAACGGTRPRKWSPAHRGRQAAAAGRGLQPSMLQERLIMPLISLLVT